MVRPFEIFYTFPQLEDDRGRLVIRQIPDAKLRQHINILRQESQMSEALLVWHLLKILRENSKDATASRRWYPNPAEPDYPVLTAQGEDSPLGVTQAIAKKLLIAFLASFSTNVAWRVKTTLENLGRNTSDINTLFADLFQTALEAALHPGEFFRNFNLDQTDDTFWYASLKSYTRQRMEGRVYDRLRQMQGFQTLKHSDLGLAARSPQKRVEEALKFAGQTQAQVTKLILAWKCFQEVKKAKGIDISSPKQEQFDAIALRYNHLSGEKYPAVNGKTIEEWLKQIGAVVRSYVDRQPESLDQRRNQEDGATSWSDVIPDPSSPLGWDALLVEEMKQDMTKLKDFLHNLLENLDHNAQEILVFTHALQMVQTQIAQEIEKDASTVSRHYNKLLQQLLFQIAEWAKQYQEVHLCSEILKSMKAAFKEQLDTYYFDAVDLLFRETFHSLPAKDWQLIQLHYLRGLDIPTLLHLQTFVQVGVANRIEKRWKLCLKPNGLAKSQLLVLMPEKVKNYSVVNH